MQGGEGTATAADFRLVALTASRTTLKLTQTLVYRRVNMAVQNQDRYRQQKEDD